MQTAISRVLRFCLTASLVLPIAACAAPPPADAVEVVLQDNQGKSAWLYTPRRIDPSKTYWLVVGVHGRGGNGQGAAGLASWAEQKGVLVLGPTFDDGYQGGNGEHETKFVALLKEMGGRYKVHPRIFLHGFSGGAQFAHRFTFRNPELVAGVSAHSGGSWEKPNPAANHIPWAVSCGTADTERSSPQLPLNRIDGFREFAAALKEQKFEVDARTFPGVDHRQTPMVAEMAATCFERVRGSTSKKK